MRTTGLRTTLGKQFARLFRFVARRRRVHLLLAMLLGLIIGMASMAVLGLGGGTGDGPHDRTAIAGAHQPGQDHDD